MYLGSISGQIVSTITSFTVMEATNTVIGREELRAVANLYSDIKTTRPLSTKVDEQMTLTFNSHIGAWLGEVCIAIFCVPPTGAVVALLDKRLASVHPEAAVACRVESLLAEHGAFDVCFQGVLSSVSPVVIDALSLIKSKRRRSRCCRKQTFWASA